MTRTSKTLIVLSALAGLAGCAYQDPLQLPNPYPSYGGDSRSYSPYGVDPLYYYGYGMTDPFYYRYGYPAYGYYPQYPVHSCVDANRDGRCDRLLISAIEHPSVLAGGRFPAAAVERLAVTAHGHIDLGAFERRLLPDHLEVAGQRRHQSREPESPWSSPQLGGTCQPLRRPQRGCTSRQPLPRRSQHCQSARAGAWSSPRCP
jgi:hypothetical protein